MVRRRLTLKRIDPWSTLKFGFIANLSLLAIWMLGAGVIWFFVQRLQLIDKVCSIATDMGFVECGVNGGNLFRALFLLGLLGVVINTGLVVFLAFLHNLIADLVGGLSFSFVDDTPGAAARGEVSRTAGATGTGQATTGAAATAGGGIASPSAGSTQGRPSSPAAAGSRATTPAQSQPRPASHGEPPAAPQGQRPGPSQGTPTATPQGQQPAPRPQGGGQPTGSQTGSGGSGAGWEPREDRVFGDRGPEQATTRVQPDGDGSQDR